MPKVWLLASVLPLAGCGLVGSSTPGDRETDRVAQVVSDAISWPRADSATGYARASADTRAGRDGRLTVVEITDLPVRGLVDPFGELVWQVHVDGSSAGFLVTDPVTACYRIEVGYYGVMDVPRRVRCPADAAPVRIPASPSSEPPSSYDRVS